MSQTILQRVFYNTNWILIEKISKALVTGLTSLLVARYLGASGLGTLSVVLTFYGIFSVLGTLGLERILLKELEVVASHPEKLMGGAILLRVWGAILGFLLLNVIPVVFYPQQETLQIMLLMVSFTFIIAVGNVFEVLYRRELLSKYVTVARVAGLLLSATTKLLLVLFQMDVAWFAVPVLLETTVVSMVFLMLRNKQDSIAVDKLEFNRRESQRLFRLAWPLFLSGFVGALYFQLDKIVIYELMDEAALGRYALLFQLVSLLLFLVHAINLSVIPVLNRLFFENEQAYWAKYREITAFKVLIALLIGTGMLLLGNVVIPFIVGEEFTYSTALLFYFSAYILFVSLGSLQAEYCILVNVVKPLFYIRVFTLAANLALNILLIPRWGLEGAAFATALSYFLNQFVFPWFVTAIRPALKQNFSALLMLLNWQLYKALYTRALKLR